jgi:NAD(P) transhydrogenase subunit alpha
MVCIERAAGAPPTMRIAVRKEIVAGERRVAIVPDSIKRLAAKQIDVSVQSGAGASSFASDAEYLGAGARVDTSAEALLSDAEAVVQIHPPRVDEVVRLPEGTVLVSLVYPFVNTNLVRALAARKITAIAVEMIPRTTVAQMMDVLSSQATAAGYEAVMVAAATLPRFFPMLMTAAGTIAPARVLVLGAGVAGLQAIGAARLLMAVVESLGAKFVEVEAQQDAEVAGGYARELSDDAKKKQSDVIALHAAKADVIICTALVPGRRAPVLGARRREKDHPRDARRVERGALS